MAIRWTTAILDYPAEEFDRGSAFWQAVTASGISGPAGERAEFVTLLPADGDPFLCARRLHGGAPGCHLDVHADDVPACAAQAEHLGATVIGEPGGYVVLRSPGGLRFCITGHDGERKRPAPVSWPGGQDSLVDQLSVDVSPGCYGRECEFWYGLTGWPQFPGSRPEFIFLGRPAGMPLRLLLQRLDAPHAGLTRCTAHLDLACDNVPAETARHQALGASLVRVVTDWTTLRDPAGLQYCITRRNPVTGKLASRSGH